MHINPGELLLKHFCGLCLLDADYANWSAKKFTDNPPRLIRLRMLFALFQYLGIRRNVNNFVEGTFIPKTYDVHALLQLLLQSDEDFDQLYTWISTGFIHRVTDDFDRYHVMFTFKYLLKYRLRLEEVYQCHNNQIICSAPLSLASAVKNHFDEKIASATRTLDRVLLHFINPENRVTTLAYLQRVHGYPAEDLDEVDMDWM